MFCELPVCPVAGKVSPYPCPDSRLWLTVIGMVHNKRILKNISWPLKKHKNQVQDHVSALLAKLVPHLLDSVLGWRPNPVSHLPALTQYCTSVWSYWWTLGSLYCNETKAKKTLTQDEANGLSGPCQRCMHSLTLAFFFSSHSPNAVNVHAGWIYRFANNNNLTVHKKPLGWRQTFPTNWAGANQEVLHRVLSSDPFTSSST